LVVAAFGASSVTLSGSSAPTAPAQQQHAAQR
jgi:hypothetical protein